MSGLEFTEEVVQQLEQLYLTREPTITVFADLVLAPTIVS
jgi:hypothetical protein